MGNFKYPTKWRPKTHNETPNISIVSIRSYEGENSHAKPSLNEKSQISVDGAGVVWAGDDVTAYGVQVNNLFSAGNKKNLRLNLI